MLCLLGCCLGSDSAWLPPGLVPAAGELELLVTVLLLVLLPLLVLALLPLLLLL